MSRKTKEMNVMTSKKITTQINCDYCKSDIESNQSHFNIITGHNEWGNDSCESIKEFHACSAKCLKKAIAYYVDSERKSQYIEIQKTCEELTPCI